MAKVKLRNDGPARDSITTSIKGVGDAWPHGEIREVTEKNLEAVLAIYHRDRTPIVVVKDTKPKPPKKES